MTATDKIINALKAVVIFGIGFCAASMIVLATEDSSITNQTQSQDVEHTSTTPTISQPRSQSIPGGNSLPSHGEGRPAPKMPENNITLSMEAPIQVHQSHYDSDPEPQPVADTPAPVSLEPSVETVEMSAPETPKSSSPELNLPLVFDLSFLKNIARFIPLLNQVVDVIPEQDNSDVTEPAIQVKQGDVVRTGDNQCTIGFIYGNKAFTSECGNPGDTVHRGDVPVGKVVEVCGDVIVIGLDVPIGEDVNELSDDQLVDPATVEAGQEVIFHVGDGVTGRVVDVSRDTVLVETEHVFSPEDVGALVSIDNVGVVGIVSGQEDGIIKVTPLHRIIAAVTS